MKKNNIYLVPAMLFTMLFLVSCVHQSSTSVRYVSKTESDMIAKYQPQVPFKVVLPKYLPKKYAFFSAGVQTPPDDSNANWFGLSYNNPAEGNINIDEAAEYKQLTPDFSSSFLNLSSINVLQEEINTEPTIQTYWYQWNQNGIYFLVTIDDLSQDERIKIIESLINQSCLLGEISVSNLD